MQIKKKMPATINLYLKKEIVLSSYPSITQFKSLVKYNFFRFSERV